MGRNKIAVVQTPQADHVNSMGTSATPPPSRPRTSCEQIRKRKFMWSIIFGLLAILIIGSIVVTIIVLKQKDLGASTEASNTTDTTEASNTTDTTEASNTTDTTETLTRTTTEEISSVLSSKTSATITAETTMETTTVRITGTQSTVTTGITFSEIKTTTKTKVPILLTTIDDTVYGVYRTRAGHDSVESMFIFDRYPGQHPIKEAPDMACDGNISTKYLSFGECRSSSDVCVGGVNTGFYLTLRQNATIATGLQICTGKDDPGRDPLVITLEGSNESGEALTKGNSWTHIYEGSSGLFDDPGRGACGKLQSFNNLNRYASYRFLVIDKREKKNCVQYAEVLLFE
ncbi:hypothetical protein I4U23_004558 [Adineta vaga]|nr:hypothetical protein I4U23_004558 [Adineta vaga]